MTTKSTLKGYTRTTSFGKLTSCSPSCCIYSGTVTQWVEQSFNPARRTNLIPTEATHSKMYKKCTQVKVWTKCCVSSTVILVGLVSYTLVFPGKKKKCGKCVHKTSTRSPLQTTYMMIYLKLLSRHKEYKQYLNGYTLSKESYMLCNWIC